MQRSVRGVCKTIESTAVHRSVPVGAPLAKHCSVQHSLNDSVAGTDHTPDLHRHQFLVNARRLRRSKGITAEAGFLRQEVDRKLCEGGGAAPAHCPASRHRCVNRRGGDRHGKVRVRRARRQGWKNPLIIILARASETHPRIRLWRETPGLVLPNLRVKIRLPRADSPHHIKKPDPRWGVRIGCEDRSATNARQGSGAAGSAIDGGCGSSLAAPAVFLRPCLRPSRHFPDAGRPCPHRRCADADRSRPA